MTDINTKVLIVGGGPGGYVAAIRCGQLGLDTVLVEGDRVGGTCLIRGCIPSKALIHVADEFRAVARSFEGSPLGISVQSPPQINFGQTATWKDEVVAKLNAGIISLLHKAKVQVITGWAHFRDGKTCDVDTQTGHVVVTAEHVILATGSVPVELPALPFGRKVVSSESLLSTSSLPHELVVIGGGYIGLELGIAFRKFGSRVTVVEQQHRVLPLHDATLSTPVERWLRANGVALHLGSSAYGMTEGGEAVVIEAPGGSRVEVSADKVLVAVGRKPNVNGWGIENLVLERRGPFVQVDEQCATSMRNVWAIGDLIGEPMLAHKAAAQGEMVAEIIAGKRRRFAPLAIPSICFTEPEVVSVGKTPDRSDPAAVVVGVFPLAANGRALSMEGGGDSGFVRVVADRRSKRILGVQAVGKGISELSAAFTHAVEMQVTLEDLAGIIHAHPTVGEAFQEAALKALGNAIHI